MLVLSIFYFLFVIYSCIKMLSKFRETKKMDKVEIVDAFTDLALSILLLLIGLSVENIIATNWIIFSIPLLFHIVGKLYLRKLTGYSVNV